MPRAPRILALVLALSLIAAPSASAHDEVRRHGSCSGGPGDWTLRVRREHGGRLRVRFRIDHVAPGESWQLFLSDNGARIFSGTRTSDHRGVVRVTRFPPNRRRSDRIAASGVNAVTATTCEGSLTYRAVRPGTVVPLRPRPTRGEP
jgi:hypothetical protein